MLLKRIVKEDNMEKDELENKISLLSENPELINKLTDEELEYLIAYLGEEIKKKEAILKGNQETV